MFRTSTVHPAARGARSQPSYCIPGGHSSSAPHILAQRCQAQQIRAPKAHENTTWIASDIHGPPVIAYKTAPDTADASRTPRIVGGVRNAFSKSPLVMVARPFSSEWNFVC
jgi:hypothetical protein